MNLFKYEQARFKAFSSMGADDEPPESFCRNICRSITVWHRNGEEVRAPNDSSRMRRGKFGWELPFGENRFAVGLAVRWSRDYLSGRFLSLKPRAFQLLPLELKELENIAAEAVVGHKDRQFFRTYPVRMGKLWMGNHVVVLALFATALGCLSGLHTGKLTFREDDL